MERFWNRHTPRFTEEDAFEFIKSIFKDFDEDDYYARGGSSSSNQRGGGGGSSSRRMGGSYNENKEAKLEQLAMVYETICSFFDELGIDPKSLVDRRGR